MWHLLFFALQIKPFKCHVSQKAATAVPHWRDQISGHNNSPRYRQKRKNQKAKIGSKVSIVGELDMHNNKLYVELHNLDFLSLFDNPKTTTSPPNKTELMTPTPFTSESSRHRVCVYSRKRSRLAKTIKQEKLQKRQ